MTIGFLYACLDHPKKYLVVFLAVQNLVGFRCSIVWQHASFNILRIRLKMSIHAPKLGILSRSTI